MLVFFLLCQYLCKFGSSINTVASLKTLTDIELATLVQQGDHAALAEVYTRYQPVLYSHAYRRFPDREQVRDIVQDVFVYLWNNREHIQLTSGLAAYLYASVRNKILNHFRDQKVRSAFSLSLLAFMDHGRNITDDLLREKELIQLVEKEVARLPPQMRLIFEMSRNGHKTHQEIADELSLSHHTVRTQIRNALRILRVKLGANIFFIFF
jgi:RNA polymerase sigma-70 factor (family 1)